MQNSAAILQNIGKRLLQQIKESSKTFSYEIRLSNISQIPNVSNGKLGILNQTPSISIKNLELPSKNPLFQINAIEILDFSDVEHIFTRFTTYF